MKSRDNRTDKSIKNLKYGITSQIIQYGLSFITRTLFILYLSKEYLGMNSVIMNILMILSLAESGIGSALQVLLYKPLHEKDFDKLNILMTYFKKLFKTVSIIVLALGIIALPLTLLIVEIEEVNTFIIVYILFLLSSFITYLSMPHQIIIRADQKSYIISIINQILSVLQYFLQILALIIFQNFILYIFIQSVCTSLAALMKVRKSKKIYKIERNHEIDTKTLNEAKTKIYAGFFHHFGYVIYNGTDNIVIASNLGIITAGLYSNYILIIGLVRTFLMIVYQSFFSSIGNMIVDQSKEINYSFFKKVTFFSFFISGFSTISLFILLNPFISLWIGDEFIFDNITVFLITVVLLFDYQGIRKSIWIYKNATGLFDKDKYISIIEGFLNIIISVILVQFMGIKGVLLGTIISHLLTSFWVQPKIVFANYFQKNVLSYYKEYFSYLLKIIIACLIVVLVSSNLTVYNWIDFIFLSIVVGITTMTLLIILNYHSDEFKYFRNLGVNKLKRLFIKK